jgi:hypothetical protein
VQDKGEAFGRAQPVEDHQQGKADRVGQHGFVFGAEGIVSADNRVWHVYAVKFLAPRPPRAQHVQAYPSGHRGEPRAEVLGFAASRSAQPQPGFLDGVIRLGQRAEHPVGRRPQPSAMRLELLR